MEPTQAQIDEVKRHLATYGEEVGTWTERESLVDISRIDEIRAERQAARAAETAALEMAWRARQAARRS